MFPGQSNSRFQVICAFPKKDGHPPSRHPAFPPQMHTANSSNTIQGVWYSTQLRWATLDNHWRTQLATLTCYVNCISLRRLRHPRPLAVRQQHMLTMLRAAVPSLRPLCIQSDYLCWIVSDRVLEEATPFGCDLSRE